MKYPVVLHKDEGSDYGVTVPDLPGCFSAGSTVDEALAMAREAIELYLEHAVGRGKAIPAPGAVEDHKNNPRYRGGTWAVVRVDPSELHVNSKRIKVAPRGLRQRVKAHAKAPDRQPVPTRRKSEQKRRSDK